MKSGKNQEKRASVRYSLLFIIVLAAGYGFQTEALDQILAYALFETEFSVNLPFKDPFDSEDIRVDAIIRSGNSGSQTVPCFYDGNEIWKLRYTPSHVGEYTYEIIGHTRNQLETVLTGNFTVVSHESSGFVRISPDSPRYFVFENGESYFPLGENLGWVSGNNGPSLAVWTGYLDECREAGINWIRIWMCSWGRTELVWKANGRYYFGLEKYSLENARMIDGIFRAAEERGIYIQWVINHHGQYSSSTNPIWNENPYNAANGSFLHSPDAFFTDAEAKRRYRDRLRYLIARWGYSTHLLAWEFWNEVDLTSNFNFSNVKSWHEEMAEYLDSADPYRHLKTTSTASDYPAIYTIQGLDYLQSHAYVNNVIDKTIQKSELVAREHPDKPHFFGEMSYDASGPNRDDRDGVILHNQLWASVHGWDSGAAMTWWWDNWIRPYNLYPHFLNLSRYIAGIDWAKEQMTPIPVQVEGQPGNLGDLTFSPGLGWGASSRSEFVIGMDGIVEYLEECSQFVHGQYHRNFAPNPVFRVDLEQPSVFGLRIDLVARAGANCLIYVDGEQVFRRVFASAQNDSTISREDGEISIPLSAGTHLISVRNTGLDWFRVQFYRLENFAQRITAYARGNRERILLWIHDRAHQFAVLDRYEQFPPLQSTRLLFPEIQIGEYTIEQFDPYSGEIERFHATTANETGLRIEIPSFQRDIAFRLQKKAAFVEPIPLK
jgi:hypothetical protein